MRKKYCITSLSVKDLSTVKSLYGDLTLKNISDFSKNESIYEKIHDCRIDVLYVFSKLIKDENEFGGILSGNIFITNFGIFGVNDQGSIEKIPKNSIVYILRKGHLPISFMSFFAKYAEKSWGIQVITNYKISQDISLSTKCYALAYLDTDNFPTSVIPYLCSEEDFTYLANFIQKSGYFHDAIIIKKAGYSSGNGIKIFKINDTLFEELKKFFKDIQIKDYIIMQFLQTEDVEYRVYWAKKHNGNPEILEVHGKERIDGHILHNIAKGNILRKLDKSILPINIRNNILSYCSNISVLHGGLDILLGKDGKYYFTENNAMTGYLCEPEEKYFAKDWLEAIAHCYTSD